MHTGARNQKRTHSCSSSYPCAAQVDGYLRIYNVAAFEAATRALLTRLLGLPAAQHG